MARRRHFGFVSKTFCGRGNPSRCVPCLKGLIDFNVDYFEA